MQVAGHGESPTRLSGISRRLSSKIADTGHSLTGVDSPTVAFPEYRTAWLWLPGLLLAQVHRPEDTPWHT